MKKALITGINGQDASYLAELLIDKGYEVHGTTRRNSVLENQNPRVDHIKSKIHIHYGDLTDSVGMLNLIDQVRPDEVYSLAAQSDVRISFEQPLYTANVNATGVLNLLETVRKICPNSKFYQAGSSEMFGNSVDPDGCQRESTQMLPVSPYGIAKLFAHNTTVYYRDRYGMFACNGIFFNHESSRRGTNFVTNKVAKTAVMIKKGLADRLMLGNLDSTRDWGHSKDYVRAMWMIMQQDQPSDYVCATGVAHSIRDMVNYVFGKLDLDWNDYVTCDTALYRNPELFNLCGDSSKLRNTVKWQPEYNFETMLDEMIEYWNAQV
jgi:GDPmannose 4,6-dehydratase